MKTISAAKARAAVAKARAEMKAKGLLARRKNFELTPEMTATGSGAVHFREFRLIEEASRAAAAAADKRKTKPKKQGARRTT
jgi:hypothetical protein